MANQKYIILRSSDKFVPTMDNLGAEHQTGTRGPVASASVLSGTKSIDISEEVVSKSQKDDLRRDPQVQAMAPPMPIKLIEPVELSENEDSAESSSTNTWGVEAVNSHISSFDGSGVNVAVLDTGIDLAHQAFEGVTIETKNFTTESDEDIHGHGTHCAGTVFGQDVDSTRIGVARNINKALIGKVLGEGQGDSSNLANAIQWSVQNGAHVISMSLGIDFPGYVKFLVDEEGWDVRPATSVALEAYRANVNLFSALSTLLEAGDAFSNGAVIIAASGNESNRPDYEIAVAPPAAGNGIISVGALQQGSEGLSIASFSNTQCNVSAPGVDVSSAALGGGLRSLNGTSMATPHVAGVAALWAQKELQETDQISRGNTIAKVLAMATRNGLSEDVELDDIGNGIVQAP